MTIESANAAKRLGKLVPNPKARLQEQFHEVARFKYFSRRTEDSYWQWAVRFMRFHRTEGKWRHPRELSPTDIAAFLSDLSSRLKVAASTQSQAFHPVR